MTKSTAVVLLTMLGSPGTCCRNSTSTPIIDSNPAPPVAGAPVGICKAASNQQGRNLAGQGFTGCTFTWDSGTPPTTPFTGDCSTCPAEKPGTVSLSNCVANRNFFRCDATATGAICDTGGGTASVLVIDGRYKANGTFVPDADTGAHMIACGTQDGGQRDTSIIYKCIHGLFEKDKSPNNDKFWSFVPGYKRFQTCVRAARADYCGDGVSHTMPGTRIDLYSLDGDPPPDCENGMCPEASWNLNGAKCVSHLRWEYDDAGSLTNQANDDCTAEWDAGCRIDNPDDVILYDRSKLHWPLADGGVCADDVKDAGANPAANNCAMDCDGGNLAGDSTVCPVASIRPNSK